MIINEPDKENELGKTVKNYGKYSAVIFQMIAIIAAFAVFGYWLDKKMNNNTPWVTAFSCLFGVCLALYLTIKQLKQ